MADLDRRRSITGYVCMQAGGPTFWSSEYQPMVATSTSKAEYMAQLRGAQQIMWMYSALEEIGLPQPRPAQLLGNNNAAHHIAHNWTGAARIKHIVVREHYIRERVSEGDVQIDYVPSADNIADLLTKPLGRNQHMRFCLALRLCEPSDPILRGIRT